jgi:uncharacterized protein (DUF433 family)
MVRVSASSQDNEKTDAWQEQSSGLAHFANREGSGIMIFAGFAQHAKGEGDMEPREIGQYLEINPRVCFGKLIFKGTRVPVSTVLTYIAKGETFERILQGWPQLTREAIAEAVELSKVALLEKYPQQRPEARREPAHPGRVVAH